MPSSSNAPSIRPDLLDDLNLRDEKGQPLAARRVAPAKAPSGETASPEPAVKAAPKQPKKEA